MSVFAVSDIKIIAKVLNTEDTASQGIQAVLDNLNYSLQVGTCSQCVLCEL